MSAIDHPQHYRQLRHEVIELVSRLRFCEGNVVKYVLRYPYKGAPDEDLGKAEWYLDYLRRDGAGRIGAGTRALMREFEADLKRVGRADSARILKCIRRCQWGKARKAVQKLRMRNETLRD